MPENFSQRLRILRNSRNIGQADLGKLVGKSPATVSDWEKGKSQPGLAEICTLADHLGVSPARLAFGDTPSASSELSGQVAANLAQEIRAEVEKLIAATEGRSSRIGWILEQMKIHLPLPEHWRQRASNSELLDPEIHREMDEENRRILQGRATQEGGSKSA